jgi:Ca2+/Na+ antiporter
LIIFILFMKQNQITFYISIFILISIFSIHQYSIYYQKLAEEEENNHQYEEIIQRLENTLVVLEVLLIILLVIGNMLYLRKQRKEYKTKFKWFSFYFGTNPCKSIKT